MSQPAQPILTLTTPAAHSEREAQGPTMEVNASVVALVPEYRQVKIRDDDGQLYAVTEKTKGVTLADLSLGQRLRCRVTRLMPRVLSASAIA